MKMLKKSLLGALFMGAMVSGDASAITWADVTLAAQEAYKSAAEAANSTQNIAAPYLNVAKEHFAQFGVLGSPSRAALDAVVVQTGVYTIEKMLVGMAIRFGVPKNMARVIKVFGWATRMALIAKLAYDLGLSYDHSICNALVSTKA